jgi:hypothetical protein
MASGGEKLTKIYIRFSLEQHHPFETTASRSRSCVMTRRKTIKVFALSQIRNFFFFEQYPQTHFKIDSLKGTMNSHMQTVVMKLE